MDASLIRRVLVTDRRLVPRAGFGAAVAARAAAGGATLVILREKDLPEDEQLALARELKGALAAPCVMAGSAHLARRAGLAGVHLGGDAKDVGSARAVLGPGATVGVSVHAVEEGIRRAAEGADWLLLGPILPTPKPWGLVTPLGFGALAELAAAVTVPVAGIGGLGPADEPRVRAAGAAGFAAIRAFLG